MVREPAAAVTAFVNVTADSRGIVATLPLVLEPMEKCVATMETVSRALLWYVSAELDSTDMTVEVSLN